MSISDDDADLVALIDSRVRRAIQSPFYMGTLETRDAVGNKARVRFDGDNNAQGVKVLATAHVFPPDRVLMVRVVGTQAQPRPNDPRLPSPGEWVVIGGFTQNDGINSYIQSRGVFVTGQSTTSGSTAAIDVPEVSPLTFVKRYDTSRAKLSIAMGVFTNNTAIAAELFMRINSVDQLCVGHTFSQAGHETMSGSAEVTGLPAGSYSVVPRMRNKTGGATQIGCNAGDYWTIAAEEIAP